MSHEEDLQALLESMRRDWDERASADAKYYVFTRDSSSDEPDFEQSGRVNYEELVRPYLPVLLNGRPPKSCRVLEIGCGVGRMTRWFAEEFLEVHGLDISAKMIEKAEECLRHYPHVVLHLGLGKDLSGLPDGAFDLVFSYIVFQHIPSRAVIKSYVREAARVLKVGGAFKFQLNGDVSGVSRRKPKDTWHGEVFSFLEACEVLHAAGFSFLAAEGIGTQHFLLTGRKGPAHAQPGLRPYILPGEAWAREQLLEGWHEPVNGSLRVIAERSRARLAVPPGEERRFFAALHLWHSPPDQPFAVRQVNATLGILPLGGLPIARPGNHYLEWPIPRAAELGPETVVTLEVHPSYIPSVAATVRCLGLYAPRP